MDDTVGEGGKSVGWLDDTVGEGGKSVGWHVNSCQENDVRTAVGVITGLRSPAGLTHLQQAGLSDHTAATHVSLHCHRFKSELRQHAG